jgi:hypothetical protein
MDEPVRKYFELGPQIYNPRRKENRRRALRIGPRAREAEKGVIGLETQGLAPWSTWWSWRSRRKLRSLFKKEE